MKVFTTIDEMREYSRNAREKGKTIGFVPTMGYFHEGHLSLIKAARQECDAVVVSVFVNPTQFGPREDFKKYPRNMARDKDLAEIEGVDVVFTPSSEEMYPNGHVSYIEITGPIAETLCGSSRPGHFRGVGTVVAKLFNIVSPHVAYFGQKDAQQTAVIKRMVRDLNMPVEIRVMPIVREADGLAMSSRNTYLSDSERQQALGIYRSLKRAGEMVSGGEISSDAVKKEIKKVLKEEKGILVDYIEVVRAEDLEPVKKITDNTLIAVAVFVGDTRLIDNVIIGGEHAETGV